MTRGLVLGKFLPPHRGHHRLIDAAITGCDELFVMVLASVSEPLPLELRARWLTERHPRARILTGYDETPVDFDDPRIWALHMAVIEDLLPAPVDVVFSGEAYGDELARRLGARHVLIDRREDGCSATSVRADLAGRWSDLDPVVREGLTRRVAIVAPSRRAQQRLLAHSRSDTRPSGCRSTAVNTRRSEGSRCRGRTRSSSSSRSGSRRARTWRHVPPAQ